MCYGLSPCWWRRIKSIPTELSTVRAGFLNTWRTLINSLNPLEKNIPNGVFPAVFWRKAVHKGSSFRVDSLSHLVQLMFANQRYGSLWLTWLPFHPKRINPLDHSLSAKQVGTRFSVEIWPKNLFLYPGEVSIRKWDNYTNYTIYLFFYKKKTNIW